MCKRPDGAGEQARKIVLTFLEGRDWTPSTDILDVVSATEPLQRSHGVAAIARLMQEEFLLRAGRPPRGCRYMLNPEQPPDTMESPADFAPRVALGTAEQYVAPAIGRGPLVQSLGLGAPPEPLSFGTAFA